MLKILKLQKFIISSILLFLLSSVSPVVFALDSEDGTEKRRNEFQLLTFCSKMDLVVEGLPDDASKINLTEESIQATVESRLRSARLYSSTNTHDFLYVRISIVYNVFDIDLSFEKIVEDKYSGMQFYATTWTKGSTGTHGGNASYILSVLSELMDIFLVEYLKVNEEYCN